MATTTAIYGWPVPELTDTPNEPQQMSDLADAIEATVNAPNVTPIGDSSNSLELTGADINFTNGNNKNILTTDITLDRDQWVIISAKAGFFNQDTGTAPLMGIYVDLGGGTPIANLTSGFFRVGANGTINERMQVTIPAMSIFLTAGAHTIRLRGDAQGLSGMSCNASGGENQNVAAKPTSLTIIV